VAWLGGTDCNRKNIGIGAQIGLLLLLFISFSARSVVQLLREERNAKKRGK
jgi:hypothetical protein